MVVKESASSQELPGYFIVLKQLLIEVQNHQDNVAIQEAIVNNIFSIISQNLSEIQNISGFADAICRKLIEFQYSRQYAERNIFERYSYILDFLRPSVKINPK